MRVIVQRVDNCSVLIDNKKEESINKGLMLLVCFTYNDTIDDINYIVKKICNLRIFSDDMNKMNLSIKDIKGDILIVSQFTLYADTKKGNRPSFNKSLPYNEAKILYDKLISCFEKENLNIKTGKFGSDMILNIVNNGPVTIIIDTKEE